MEIVHVFSIDLKFILKNMLLYDVISEVECFFLFCFILYYLLCKIVIVLLVTLILPFDKRETLKRSFAFAPGKMIYCLSVIQISIH